MFCCEDANGSGRLTVSHSTFRQVMFLVHCYWSVLLVEGTGRCLVTSVYTANTLLNVYFLFEIFGF